MPWAGFAVFHIITDSVGAVDSGRIVRDFVDVLLKDTLLFPFVLRHRMVLVSRVGR